MAETQVELPEDDQTLMIELDPEGDDALEEAGKKVQQDDPAKDLAEQLEALKLAQKQELETVTRERDEAIQYAQQRERQAYEEHQRANQEHQARSSSESEMVQSALQAAQAERTAARQALKTAKELGDVEAEADATEKLSRSAGLIQQYEVAAAQLAQEQQREAYYARQAQEQPRQQQSPRQLTAEERLAQVKSNPNLQPQEKEFLDKHPELVTNPALNKELDTVYKGTVRLGLIRGTPEYFDHIEKAMGLTQERQTNMGARVSAPVSRSSARSGASPREVKLTERDIEIANGFGFKSKEDLQQYARNKIAVTSGQRKIQSNGVG